MTQAEQDEALARKILADYFEEAASAYLGLVEPICKALHMARQEGAWEILSDHRDVKGRKDGF